MTTNDKTGVWPTVLYRDAEAGLAWLSAIGFTELGVYRDPQDASIIVHAELAWPTGGGIMAGTYRESNTQWPQTPGTTAVYLVTDTPDALHTAALAAGGTELAAVIDQDYGGRGGSVRDPEGNLWSFGHYRPEL